ncbi:hypothetical protein [Amycolatopsis sp. WGS_07]|uniref:hypothetical protein n=1 Tax=Amycolatopsis sp. WGS_07 TaxID=3076764 RepID=UPI003872CEE2
MTPAPDETDVGAYFGNILSQPKAALREDVVRAFAQRTIRATARWPSTAGGCSWCQRISAGTRR